MPVTRIVADVGGTNARLAVFDETDGSFRHVTSYANTGYACLEDLIDSWLATLKEPAPRRACIAAAAPPSGDMIRMINIGWEFSCRELSNRYQLEHFSWLNDFQANAHSLPHLGDKDLVQVNAGDDNGHRILATVGPGTGLGGATLQHSGERVIALDSEPGHAGLSPGTDLELEVFRRLLVEHRDIYAELLVSGAGLARLYNTIAQINGTQPEQLTPADVSTRALNDEDENCLQALETFCALLGSACGDFVLSNGAYGGLYIAGGIIPRMTAFLQRSSFLQRFQAKGSMTEHLRSVPVYAIVNDNPGLVGAAHAPLQAV